MIMKLIIFPANWQVLNVDFQRLFVDILLSLESILSFSRQRLMQLVALGFVFEFMAFEFMDCFQFCTWFSDFSNHI